jgi:hypothetical protein
MKKASFLFIALLTASAPSVYAFSQTDACGGSSHSCMSSTQSCCGESCKCSIEKRSDDLVSSLPGGLPAPSFSSSDPFVSRASVLETAPAVPVLTAASPPSSTPLYQLYSVYRI